MTEKIFIANLDSDITADDLKESLEHYGKVASIELQRAEEMALVEFVETEDAVLALRSMEGMDFLGRQLRVGWYRGTSPGKYKKAS